MDRKYNEILKGLEDGTFDESKAVGKLLCASSVCCSLIHYVHAGLVEHWLVEGKLSKEVALMLSCDMLAVGIDTVSLTQVIKPQLNSACRLQTQQASCFTRLPSIPRYRKSCTRRSPLCLVTGQRPHLMTCRS